MRRIVLTLACAVAAAALLVATETTDDFSTDPSSRWTAQSGTLERDSSGVVIDSTDGADATSLSIPYQVHDGANRILVVRLLYYRSSTKQLSVSYAGNALTQLGAARYPSNDAGDYAEIWYLLNPPAGSGNVVVSTPNGAATTAAVEAWTGADQSTPWGTFTAAIGDYPSQSPSLTVSAAVDDVVLDVFGGYSGVSNRTLSAGSNQTSDGVYPSPQSSTMHFLGVSQRTATGTSVPMSWSLSSPADGYAWWYGAAALKPAADGGGGEPSGTCRRLLMGVGRCE